MTIEFDVGAAFLFHEPMPYDFFFATGVATNVSDFETVLALLASSHGFLVATAAPPPDDDDGDEFLFHEPIPYPARAEDDRRGWGAAARKASVPPSAAAVERARRLNFMVALCRCRLAAGEHHHLDVVSHQ